MAIAIGHGTIGFHYVSISLWWIYCIYRDHFDCISKNRKFKSNTWFPLSTYPNFPAEVIYKVLTIPIGIIQQLFIPPYLGTFDHTNVSHSTMIFFFVIQAVTELLQFLNFPSIPQNANYFTYIFAFFIEGTIFYYHTAEKPPFEVLMHILLIISIAGSFFSLIWESVDRENMTAALVRAFFVLLHGTWFLHIALIMFGSTYSLTAKFDGSKYQGHEVLMFMVLHFTWYAALDFVIIIGIGAVVAYQYRKDLDFGFWSKIFNLGSSKEDLKDIEV